MADTLTPIERSKRMSLIRSKNTTIEVVVRKYLFSKGYRYRINDKRFPGHPDIVLTKYKTIVFINGCFWHGHTDCKVAHIPKSNSEFWAAKIKRNIENDKKHTIFLQSQGWQVITLWECEIKSDFEETMSSLLDKLNKNE